MQAGLKIAFFTVDWCRGGGGEPSVDAGNLTESNAALTTGGAVTIADVYGSATFVCSDQSGRQQ
jgi:hypothetical protein